MKTACLAMDIGGTFIKRALVSPEKRFLTRPAATPIDSRGDAATVLKTFRDVVAQSEIEAKALDRRLTRIAVAICGPFDYANGVSLMTEDKYRSIYNVNLKNIFLRAPADADNVEVSFFHDVQAFLLGQSFLVPEPRVSRSMAVTLGTGVGSAFMENGTIVPPGHGVPDKGLGRLPWRDGKVEDYIGAAALTGLYRKSRPDATALSVREIAELARRGDVAAREVFRSLGDTLGETLAPLLKDFSPGRLFLGGQISRAYDLFRGPFLARAASWLAEEKIVPASDLEAAALLGAVIAAESR